MKKLKLIALTALIGLNIANGQSGQKVREQNPYTLVYEGAITENVKGKVNIHPVNYKIREISIVANVYTPPNYDPNQRIFYYRAIKDGPVSYVAAIDKGSIVITIALAFILLKEPINAKILIGGALILAGMIVLIWK